MKKIIFSEGCKFILCFLGLIICSIITLDFAFYYDTMFFAISLVPILIIARLLDDYVRDTIIILRDNQTTLATILSTIILLLSLLCAYFIFTSLMHQTDIIEVVLDFIAKFVDVSGAKSALGIN